MGRPPASLARPPLNGSIVRRIRAGFLMSTIDVKWAERPAGSMAELRRYRDLVIDGVPVSSLVRIDVISPFGWGSSDDEERAAVERLVGRAPPDLPGDRTSLYVCPECGDLGCTAVSIRVDFQKTTVTWKEFGYQNNYDGEIQLEPLSHIGPYTFQRDIYERVVSGLTGTEADKGV